MSEEKPNDAKPMLAEAVVELTEPNHLDYKVKNKYDEWVWKSPYAMNRYADDWEAWHNQEREKFKQEHGLSDAELNYRGENENPPAAKPLLGEVRLLTDKQLADAFNILFGKDWKTYWCERDKAAEMRSIFNGGTQPCRPFSNWVKLMEFLTSHFA